MSSIWFGIKIASIVSKPYIGWLIGNGEKIDFWRDLWATEFPLREYIDLPKHLWKKCKAKLCSFINSEGWNVPRDINIALMVLGINLHNIPCNPFSVDTQIRKPEINGEFSVKSALETTGKKEPPAWWWKFTWNKSLHPRLSIFAWRLMNHVLHLDDTIQSKGICLTSVYSCFLAEKHDHHLFIDCETAQIIWSWATSIFCFPPITGSDSWCTILNRSKNKSSYITDLWITMVFSICNRLYVSRNKLWFDDRKTTTQKLPHEIFRDIADSATLSKSCMQNNSYDLQVIKALKVSC
ncbi:hypothetical protein GIB67_034757 [Kingdonia uniflora]|uniref:Reverse transcriptase zinc-binding domain-containing protein n=1 Tax=Kingdonia uniflora TaxID=39325 RepID=A0A7J7MDS4_9MAGN|nr:hypothetical protein GIB67_034757 [Kingdonia uniflora]